MKLTFEEHKLIGKALKLINHKICLQDYKFKNKIEMRKSPMSKVYELNIKMKDLMEQILFKDFPKDATTNVYYGRLEDE